MSAPPNDRGRPGGEAAPTSIATDEPSLDQGADASPRQRRVHGLDGKSYPSGRATTSERLELVGMAHQLRHDGLSLRSIVAELSEQGAQRSLGWVSGALRDWTCTRCSGGADSTPEHSADRAVAG